jgi:2-phospho-L-lactate guanylyltransferase
VKVGALVPFKCFTRAKKRLRSRFSDADVEAIGRAMLADVLDALRGAQLDAVVVLTDDTAVADVARGAGARVQVRAPDPGLNEAIDLGSAELARQGFDAGLVVLGDLPLLQAADIDRVLDHASACDVLVVPAADGGTAMLWRRPPSCMPAGFGPDSAEVHVTRARAAGLAVARFDALPEDLRVDLDTPEDAARLLRSARPCRTREVLEKLCP